MGERKGEGTDHATALCEEDVDPDPVAQFTAWFDQAGRVMRQPEAIALATATTGGVPSVRMVLLKGWDERGFVFYTNTRSRKGSELEQNPRAALVAYWDPLGRQVRIEGPVAPVTEEEADEYFATRPRGSQLGAHASAQSEVIDSRAAIEAQVAALSAQYAAGVVPRPAWWSGYRLRPEVFELWQHREDRLHDRLRYRRAPGPGASGEPDGEVWRIERLQP